MTDLTVGNQYFGFTLKEKSNINDIKCEYAIFKHDKTDAELLFLYTDDDNKSFAISFKTPSSSSNGIAHIMEHSVLCGSRKFPLKDPFMSLAKTSVNTFLNAMTASDHTMYPFASQNEKDFLNLMDVYLDAVFYPNLLKDETILQQEGWHYELESKDAPMQIKGVVYGEMQGAFSSPERLLYSEVQSSLYPDNNYAFESGGIPEEIPTLTQKEFVEFHQKYYHPSNSKILIYGDVDILKYLEFINENYLKDFDKIEANHNIPKQIPFTEMRVIEKEYPIANEANEEGNYYFALNYSIKDIEDPEFIFAFSILNSILNQSQAAPLKNAILKANIAMDFTGYYDKDCLQPYLTLMLNKTSLDKKETFIKIVEDTLRNLVTNGIDKKLIKASIAKYEFDLRENESGSFPKGLMYAFNAFSSWNHGLHPTRLLKFENYLNQIKEKAENGYFENLIEEFLLNNSHKSFVTLIPKKGLAEEKHKNLTKKLEDLKSQMSDDELEKIISQTRTLQQKQMTPDSQEVIDMLPTLKISDLKKEAESLPIDDEIFEGIRLLNYDTNTSGITYLNVLFDLHFLPQEYIQYYQVFTALLGGLDTKKFSYQDLSNEIKIHTGGISFSSNVHTLANDEGYKWFHTIRGKALNNNFQELLDLTSEIIFNTKFDNKSRILEILKSEKSYLDQNLLMSGHTIGIRRMLSYSSAKDKLNEMIHGIDYHLFINDLIKNYDDKYEVLISNIAKIRELIYNKHALLISITSPKENYEAHKSMLPQFINSFSKSEVHKQDYKFKIKYTREAISTPGNVSYVTQGYNYKKLGIDYDGAFAVISNLLSIDYLINKVRVMGGAYGCFGSMDFYGAAYFASYRDPNLKSTLEAYQGMVDYIENLDIPEKEIEKIIIGTIGRLDKPASPSLKGLKALNRYITKTSDELLQKERDQILQFTKDKFKETAPILKKILDKNHICVVGNSVKIEENKELFDSIITL